MAAAIYACHWLPLGFGATVYPRTAALAGVETAPGAERLATLLSGASHAALYRDDLERRPELLRMLEGAGFDVTSRHAVAASRPVTLSRRRR